MKKSLCFLLLLFPLLFATAGEKSGGNPVPDTAASKVRGRYLVLYCSRTDNTGRIARQIRRELVGDILEVEPAVPYDNNYQTMLDRARKELSAIAQGDYPPIKTAVESFGGYDIVFVGYPIWYGSMATPMQAFLREHAAKLAGKRIVLFATSGSSGISASADQARSLCPDADISPETLLLTSSTLSQATKLIPVWLGQVASEKTTTQNVKKTEIPQNISAFPTGDENSAYAQYFTGKSWLARLTAMKELNTPVSNVTFEPGCRNNWHSHTGGQVLIAVGGTGYYQEKGKPARRLSPGDVVEIAPDVVHWHGAAPESWFSHLAVECNPQTNKNTWLAPVTDEEYAEAVGEAKK